MLTEIYAFIEARCGVSYDFNQQLVEMKNNNIFADPNEFWINYVNIRDQLSQCLAVLKENKDELNEDLPTYEELVVLFTATIMNGITSTLNDTIAKLGISPVDFKTVDDLDIAVDSFTELCVALRDSSLEQFIENDSLNKLNVEFDNALYDIYQITSNDIPKMYDTYNAIIESLEE